MNPPRNTEPQANNLPKIEFVGPEAEHSTGFS